MEGLNENVDASASTEALVKKNYNLMNREMVLLLGGESIGGNAGAVEIEGKSYTCAAANCYVSRETGEIIMFGNYQYIPPKIRDVDVNIVFRVAVDFKGRFNKFHNGFFRIVNTLNLDYLSQAAQEVIEQSVNEYNNLDIKKMIKIES